VPSLPQQRVGLNYIDRLPVHTSIHVAPKCHNNVWSSKSYLTLHILVPLLVEQPIVFSLI
jgi:hypothetical protein